jgi:putative oxidoreductase
MFQWFKRNKDVGLLLLRLFIGSRLLYGVLDNILHWENMLEFEAFLKSFQFPFPFISAVVSVYAQAIAGIMILIGFKIRWAALLMIVNFSIAYIMVHWGEPYDASTAPLAMLFSNGLFLFTGAGKYSIDREAL